VSQQINLFNPIFLQTKKVFTAVTMAQALGVLVVGIVALAVYGNQSVAAMQKQADAGTRRLEAKQARLASVNADFAPRQKSADVASQLAEAEAQLAALQRVAGVLERGELGNTQGFSEYFKALARQNVDGLWLTGVAVAGGGNDIGVRGRALDATLLPGYLGRLTREPRMQGKAFGSLQINQAAPLKSIGADGKETTAPAPFVEFSLQSKPEGLPP
jgi:hypothetical protein